MGPVPASAHLPILSGRLPSPRILPSGHLQAHASRPIARHSCRVHSTNPSASFDPLPYPVTRRSAALTGEQLIRSQAAGRGTTRQRSLPQACCGVLARQQLRAPSR